MKTIGKTNDHNYIVEMTPDEHNVLAHLAGISQGWDNIHMLSPRERYLDYDFTRPLERVLAFTATSAEVNSLLNTVNRIKSNLESMGKKDV